MPRRLRSIALRLLAIAVSSLLALLVLEVAIRLFVPASQWRYRDASMDWQPDPRLGWVLRPSLDVTTRSEQGETVRFRTNPDGLTPWTARREREPGVLRILIVGDSTVVGRAVPPEMTVHAALQRLLARGGRRVEVLNGGVEGYSTDQVLLRMEQLLPLYRPDVVLYGLCENDFGGNAVGEAYGVAKPRYVLEGDGRLELIPPPEDGRRQEIQRFNRGPRSWIQHAAVYRIVRPRVLVLRARLGDWENRNLIGLPMGIYSDPREMEALDWKLLAALLREMRDVSARHGARFLFYSHPAIAEVWDPYIRETETQAGLAPGQYDRFALQKRLQAAAQAESVAYCPLIERFLADAKRGPFHLLPRDPHCNAVGYQVTAEGLASCLSSARQ
jgi:lysophospholipase L1-like esterase